MKAYFAGILLATAHIASANIGGSFNKVTTDRCNGNLAVRDKCGNPVRVQDTTKDPGDEGFYKAIDKEQYEKGNDFYNTEGGTRFKEEYEQCEQSFSMFDKACERYNAVLEQVEKDFEDYNTQTAKNHYVQNPSLWQSEVAKRLHRAGCAIDPKDKNLENYLEMFNYPFQQILRMRNARRQAIVYEDKISELQQDWANTRNDLVEDMKDLGDKMDRFIKDSDISAAQGRYAKATAELLGEENSAKSQIKHVRVRISKHAGRFEKLAHGLKRDSLRWSKFNQMTGETERLNVLTDVIRLGASDLLAHCLTNFQLAYVGDTKDNCVMNEEGETMHADFKQYESIRRLGSVLEHHGIDAEANEHENHRMLAAVDAEVNAGHA